MHSREVSTDPVRPYEKPVGRPTLQGKEVNDTERPDRRRRNDTCIDTRTFVKLPLVTEQTETKQKRLIDKIDLLVEIIGTSLLELFIKTLFSEREPRSFN